MQADTHPDNTRRLAALRSYGLLDTPRSAEFDEIVELVSALCDVPMSLISLVDEDRQWFLAETGIGIRSTPVPASICAHAILQDDFFEISDLTRDDRFSDNPFVTDAPNLRFYAGALLRSADGLPLGTLCALDVTERKFTPHQRQIVQVLARRVSAEFELRRHGRQLVDLADTLDRTLRDREAVVDVVAHDMRSPLSTVTLTADMLERGLLADRQDVLAERLFLSSRQMHRLVDDLLDFSSMRDGVLSNRSRVVDIGSLLAAAVELTRVTATAKDVTVALSVDAEIGAARWDADRLTQVILNLVGNALKFTPAGRKVTVSAIAEGANIVLHVVDTGEGIAAEQISTLFEPFVQGDAGDVRGVGLGMALVKGIVESHAGTISVSSTLGAGTDICMVLPRGPADERGA